MTYDPKLVEAIGTAVAVAWSKWVATENKGPDEWLEDWLGRAALAAIDDSGTHWIADYEPKDLSDFAYRDNMREAWEAFRDACLAERRGDGR